MFVDMLPLDPFLLFYMKVFMFFTCVFFWVKFVYDSIRRASRIHRRRFDEDE